MNLLCVGSRRWSVLITEQVRAELSDWGSAKEPKIAMISLLVDSLSEYGPQEGNPMICKPLHGTEGLAEFRKNKHRGPKVRVLWFYGDSDRTVIVCARAFVKTFKKTPLNEIEATEATRRAYFDALHGGNLIIEEGWHLVRRK